MLERSLALCLSCQRFHNVDIYSILFPGPLDCQVVIELKRISQKTMAKGKPRKLVSLQPVISWSSFVDASFQESRAGVPWGHGVPECRICCLAGKKQCDHLHTFALGMHLHGGHDLDSTREAHKN